MTREIRSWLSDMDGVLVHEGTALPGAADFVRALRDNERPFLVLTNNSIFTPRDLRARLATSGIDLPEDAIWTSALATAQFLVDQMPHGSAYVIGEAGLTTALYEAGYTLTAAQPDFVVLGETRTYSFEAITQAIRLIQGGARFIATNPDVTGPSADGDLPATGAVAAMIRAATGPQPLLRRQAQPDDDPLGAQPDRRALRDHRDGRRPHGHRRGRGHRGRPAHLPGAVGLDPRARTSSGSRSGPARCCRRWRTWSSGSEQPQARPRSARLNR